jgi:methyl-accepting chemotaxis protein
MTTQTTDDVGAINQSADHVEQRVESAVGTMQQRIVESIQPAAEQAQSFAERQKSLGAAQLGGVARAVHSAAREFETQMPLVAKSVHDAAQRLEGAADSLQRQSPGELLSGLNQFARDRPGLFFGAAIAAGFAASRFLKSTAGRSGGA